MDKKSFNEYIKELDDGEFVYVDTSYEKQWAEAIDAALADAAIDAFKTCMKTRILEVLNKPEPTNRDYIWLQKQMETKIDTLDKIIHLSKTEDVTHEHSEGPGEGRENQKD